jgi:protein-disulfide isomerase
MVNYCAVMTDQQPTVPDEPQPAPTTVVGYPSVPAAAHPSGQPTTGQANPGMASLRSAVSTVRVLVIASLALLLVLSAGVVLGIASLRSQIDVLQAQGDALQAQVTALADAPDASDAAVSAEGTASGGAGAEAEEPAQLGPAAELADDVVLPQGVDATGAVLIGDPGASNVVEVYVDYQCPYCQRWEQEVGTALVARALTPGSGVLVKQYNLAFLGEETPTLEPPGASARAASAAACVLEGEGAEAFVSFNAALFGSPDPASQFVVEALAALAGDVGASPGTIACIEENRHVPYVATSTQTGFGRGVGGTPTVLVNGRTLANPFEDAELKALAVG